MTGVSREPAAGMHGQPEVGTGSSQQSAKDRPWLVENGRTQACDRFECSRPRTRLYPAVSAAGSIRIDRMLVHGRFRPTTDGWSWLAAESAASHVKQGIFPCFKIPVCSCGAFVRLDVSTQRRDGSQPLSQCSDPAPHRTTKIGCGMRYGRFWAP